MNQHEILEVFDPALSYFDPLLVQFAADLKWVEKLGIKVSRHNLGKEPQAFAVNLAVAKEMEAGMDRLPVIVVDGGIVSTRHISLSPTNWHRNSAFSVLRGNLTRRFSGVLLHSQVWLLLKTLSCTNHC